jgi:hypothetical protein
MELREYLETYTYEVAFWAAGIDNPNYPIDQFGGLAENVSEQLRTLAIIILLVEGNTDLFYHNLIRSGLARVKFLQRCQQEGFADFHLAISRCGAICDALAAGDFNLAHQIAELSPDDWVQNGEYEDDYCFSRFLHLAAMGRAGQEDAVMLLQRFETALSGEPNVRLDLCRALDAREQAAFDSAFEAYIEGHSRHLEEDSGRMEDTHVVAERHIFVEGLAMLRLAERMGLQTQPEYKYCPALARQPMVVPFPGE